MPIICHSLHEYIQVTKYELFHDRGHIEISPLIYSVMKELRLSSPIVV